MSPQSLKLMQLFGRDIAGIELRGSYSGKSLVESPRAG